MSSLPFTVSNPEDRPIARTMYAEDAACLVALNGTGSRIRHDGRIVWREGKEDRAAADSYDHVAVTVYARIDERNRTAFAARYGTDALADALAERTA